MLIIGALVYAFINHQSSPTTPLPAGTTVYDVRTADEYAVSHVKGATLWPLADIQAGKYPPVAKDAAIAVYCHSGNRSAQATALLQKAGYTHIINMGGIASTADYGLSIE